MARSRHRGGHPDVAPPFGHGHDHIADPSAIVWWDLSRKSMDLIEVRARNSDVDVSGRNRFAEVAHHMDSKAESCARLQGTR